MHQKQNPAGFYTKGEEIFNAVSHGAGSVLAIGGTGALVALAAALANASASSFLARSTCYKVKPLNCLSRL